jgi:hypothetical protein
MGKTARSPQNGKVPSETVARQRPEEILAQTLSPAPHPEATDGWSARGRRIFLVAMAVAGVLLVVAGLLVSKELAPGPGNPAPLETGPGNGLADQLLQSSTEPGPSTPSASTPIALPLPATPSTRATGTVSPSPTPGTVPPPNPTTNPRPQSTTPPPAPTTTIPCGGLLGQGLQQTQIPLPCRAPTSSPLGSNGL